MFALAVHYSLVSPAQSPAYPPSRFATPALAQAYPTRPITLIVPWGAGGGTDATARIIGGPAREGLGQPVNVVNRTGGSGVVGHAAIASAAPDGYTIGLATVEIGMMHWQGLTELTGASYTPIGLVNADPAGIQVRADSPYKTVKELLAAIKANPGKFKASGTGQGGIWHLALAGMLRDQKIDPASVPWVPCNGAAPGLQDMVAGGVEIAPVSLPEARSLIDAGKVKSLAVMSDKPAALYPERADAEGRDRQRLDDGRLARHRRAEGHPGRVRDKLAAAVQKVADSKEYTEFMASRGFGVIYAGPEEFAQVHGQVRRRTRRDDEGRRHREVDAGRRVQTVRRLHETQRRRLRAAAAAAGRGSAGCACRAIPKIPGQQVGPALFPGLIARGLCVCGAAADRARLRGDGAAARLGRLRTTGCARRGTSLAGGACSARSCSTSWRPTGWASCSPRFVDPDGAVSGAAACRSARALLIAVVATLVIHFAFYKLLRVPLPWGVLQDFAW